MSFEPERQGRRRDAYVDRPLSLDELAARPDLPATADVPQRVAAARAQPRVHIAGMTRQAAAAELLRAVEGTEDEFEMRLPAGAFLGRPGRSGERLERAEQDLPAEDHTPFFRPDWATQSFQPRQASQFAMRPPMTRIDGRQMEPYYGVYGPDDRQVYYPNRIGVIPGQDFGALGLDLLGGAGGAFRHLL